MSSGQSKSNVSSLVIPREYALSIIIGMNGITSHELEEKDNCRDTNMDNKTHTQPPSKIHELVEEVKQITAVIKGQEKSDEIEGEWQTLAKVFDRLFFVAFFVIFLGSSLVILIPIYSKHCEKLIHK